MRFRLAWIGFALAAACAPTNDATHPAPTSTIPADTAASALTFRCDRVTLGSPVAVCLDFGGAVIVVDASPPRLVKYDPGAHTCTEFQSPAARPAFQPSDVSVRGFFVYAVDETNRMLLRWDSSGSYRDVLLSFEELDERRRVSPCGLDVDASGRLAVTDVENHQVIVLDSYLHVDVTFGNYGSFPGQLDTPLGVSFTPRGELLVADTGNARLQVFSDAGQPRRVIPAPGSPNPLRHPRRAVAAEDGRIFVADPLAHRVFEFGADGAFARALVPEGTGPFEPSDVALGRDGTLYVTDTARKVVHALKGM
jgi:sugar lactone lactonase YvrE